MSDDKTGTNPTFEGEPPEEATPDLPPGWTQIGRRFKPAPGLTYDLGLDGPAPRRCTAIRPSGRVCGREVEHRDGPGPATVCADCWARQQRARARAEAEGGDVP